MINQIFEWKFLRTETRNCARDTLPQVVPRVSLFLMNEIVNLFPVVINEVDIEKATCKFQSDQMKYQIKAVFEKIGESAHFLEKWGQTSGPTVRVQHMVAEV